MSGVLDYRVIDVFTDRAYAGNPLAVVLDADELSGTQLQAIAREFNLSETAFPLSPGVGADYRLRIFTPETELPFAGHPSVGTAWLLRELGRIGEGWVIQECGAGLLPVELAGERVTLTGGTPMLGGSLPAAQVAAAVGLAADDAVAVEARWAGTGIEFCYLQVRPDAVARADPDLAALRRMGGAGVVVFSWDGETRRAHSRVFAVGAGVAEDPATGSAALALGVWLAAAGLVASHGETAYLVEQGAECGRPSRLDCVVSCEAGIALATRVSGSVVPVAQGRIRVPQL